MLLLYARAAAVGLGIAVAVGAGLTFISLSFLTLVPILLTGFLVGEAVSNAGLRRPDRTFAVIAFVCACIGPTLGRALVLAFLMPVPDPGARVTLGLIGAMQSLSGFGALMALIAGGIAASRVTRY
jgi:hypothetical protein